MRGPSGSTRLEPRDPGAQPERTRLAWRRTTLAFAVAAALAARAAFGEDTGAAGRVAAALGGLSWVGFLLLSHRRIGHLTDRDPHATTGRPLVAAAGLTLALCAFGLFLV